MLVVNGGGVPPFALRKISTVVTDILQYFLNTVRLSCAAAAAAPEIPLGKVSAVTLLLGNFSDDQLDSGWLHLTVASNPGVSNRLQAEGAGLVEGFLTKEQITHYYQEFIHRDLCGVSTDFCRWTRELLSRQRRWQEEQIRLKGQEPYWEQVGLFYVQMEGLKQGWLARSRQEGGNVPENFDQDWFAYFFNFLPDISDYIHQYKAELQLQTGIWGCQCSWLKYSNSVGSFLKCKHFGFRQKNQQVIFGLAVSL